MVWFEWTHLQSLTASLSAIRTFEAVGFGNRDISGLLELMEAVPSIFLCKTLENYKVKIERSLFLSDKYSKEILTLLWQ